MPSDNNSATQWWDANSYPEDAGMGQDGAFPWQQGAPAQPTTASDDRMKALDARSAQIDQLLEKFHGRRTGAVDRMGDQVDQGSMAAQDFYLRTGRIRGVIQGVKSGSITTRDENGVVTGVHGPSGLDKWHAMNPGGGQRTSGGNDSWAAGYPHSAPIARSPTSPFVKPPNGIIQAPVSAAGATLPRSISAGIPATSTPMSVQDYSVLGIRSVTGKYGIASAIQR